MLRAILGRGSARTARLAVGDRPLAGERRGGFVRGLEWCRTGPAGEESGWLPLHEQSVLYPQCGTGVRRLEDVSFDAGGPGRAQSWAADDESTGGVHAACWPTTACLLIRVGRLWDDLRSLLVLVVMMFLAIAMSCDDTMAANPNKGALGYIGGFAFAVAVTEGVLHAIRLRLPGWYRLAYHAILALVFLYPLALIPLLGDPENPSLQWALFGFSPMAALAITTLVPAARRGRAYLEKNGSPWRWPMYPWALFFVLVGGLCVRCMLLCVSFHYVEGSRTIFGPYFLVPIGLAVSLVWLEIGIASGRRGIMTAASTLPLGLVYLALMSEGKNPVYSDFLKMFMGTLGGSPAYLTLLAATLFQAYAVSRRVPRAWDLSGRWPSCLAGAGGGRPGDDRSLRAESHRGAVPMMGAGLVLAAARLAASRLTARGTRRRVPGRRDHARNGRRLDDRRALADRAASWASRHCWSSGAPLSTTAWAGWPDALGQLALLVLGLDAADRATRTSGSSMLDGADQPGTRWS